jgi:serine/threonine protein kinase
MAIRCDFGLSTLRKDEKRATVGIFGSPAYAAPELPTPSHTEKVDVFSFAVM